MDFEDCSVVYICQAHERFGVHGQCLFVVRPDHHVGFRSEPIRAGGVWAKMTWTHVGPDRGSNSIYASGPLLSLEMELYITPLNGRKSMGNWGYNPTYRGLFHPIYN